MFDLQGTDRQRDLVTDALNRCDYPFDRLQPGLRQATGRETIPVDWQDLSRYAAILDDQRAEGGHTHVHEEGDTAHPLEVDDLDGRHAVLGLAWYSGRVTLSLTLETDPELAAEVFLAEAAHMVDFFALEDRQRVAIWNAFHPDHQHLPDEAPVSDAVDLGHGHGWFDVGPYGAWLGESWMEGFVRAFSDVNVVIRLGHPMDPDGVDQIRDAVLGPDDVEPDEAPYFGIEGSTVYHDTHGGVRRDVTWPTRLAAEQSGRRPCGTCRP